MEEDDGLMLNLDGMGNADAILSRPKKVASGRKPNTPSAGAHRHKPKDFRRRQDDSDLEEFGVPDGFGIIPVSKPKVMVNRLKEHHAPAAPLAAPTFRFGFAAPAVEPEEPKQPSLTPNANGVFPRPFKPREDPRVGGGSDGPRGPGGQGKGQAGGAKGPQGQKGGKDSWKGGDRDGKAPFKGRMGKEDVEEELDRKEIDRDGLQAILGMVQRTKQRDRDLAEDGTEAQAREAAPSKSDRRGRATLGGEAEARLGGVVTFEDDGLSNPKAGKGRGAPSAKRAQELLRSRFGEGDESEEDDGLEQIRQQEREVGGAEEGPDDFEFQTESEDSDPDGEEDGVRAAYGRSIGLPSTSGRRLVALEAQERRKQALREQKKARKKAGIAAVGSRVAHVVGELTHAGPVVKGEVGQEIFGSVGAGSEGTDSDDPWRKLGLAESLAAHLKDLHFVAPTKIQQLAIPGLLSGRDCLVNAPTGSGKTLAYLAPIVQDLQAVQPRISRADGTYAIVVAPTRELCIQIVDVLTLLLRRYHWVVGGSIMGGENRTKEKSRLRKGVSVLVASPGRLLDHLQQTQAFRTDRLRWLVLDEADRLLDMGFEAKLKEMVQLLDKRKAEGGDRTRYRRALLSATLHSQLSQLATVSLHKPLAIGFNLSTGSDGQLAISRAEHGDDEGEQGQDGAVPIADDRHDMEEGTFRIPKQLKQSFVQVPAKQRLAALVGFLRMQERRPTVAQTPPKVVVFMSSCDGVDFHHRLLTEMQVRPPKVMKKGHPNQDRLEVDDDDFDLDGEGEEAAPTLLALPIFKLHGNMVQSQRTSTFFDFARCQSGVLLCTDVAARGLDFPAVTTIVQFDPPGEPSEYVHRVGRTARLGQKGESLLFLMPSERDYADLLRSNGVSIGEDMLDPLVRHLPAFRVKAPMPGMKRGRGGDDYHGSGSSTGLVADFQFRVTRFVATSKDLQRLAADAFRSYVRAYAVHPASVRSIFHVKKLHLGHVAGSFGLKETPSLLGSSKAKEEAAKKRKEDELKKSRKQKKMGRMAGEANDEYNVVPAKKKQKRTTEG